MSSVKIEGSCLGEERRGREIGRNSTHIFIWGKCPGCGLVRWVQRKGELKKDPEDCFCRLCNSKKHAMVYGAVTR